MTQNVFNTIVGVLGAMLAIGLCGLAIVITMAFADGLALGARGRMRRAGPRIS